MPLDGEQLYRLSAEISKSFSIEELRRFLRLELDLDLDELCSPSLPKPVRVFEVVSYADRRDLTSSLLQRLAENAPNRSLRAVAEELLETTAEVATSPPGAISFKIPMSRIDTPRGATVASESAHERLAAELLTPEQREALEKVIPAALLGEASDEKSARARLVSWLNAAVALAAGTPQEAVLRSGSARVSPDSKTTELPDSDLDELLEGETGGLEIAERDETLGVMFLHGGALASKAIARLEVHRHFEGEPFFVSGDGKEVGRGTGWLIAPGLLMTNHHVVDARYVNEPAASEKDFELQGAATDVLFDYYAETSPPQQEESVRCVAHDADLDYAVLELGRRLEDRRPLVLRQNPLTKRAGEPLSRWVNVLQHPDGHAMRLGFRNNFVISASAEKLSYLTDTRGGASGAPVLDDHWLVAALHRGWRNIPDGPILVRGVEIWQENYGTPIGLILSHIEENFPEVGEAIRSGKGLPVTA